MQQRARCTNRSAWLPNEWETKMDWLSQNWIWILLFVGVYFVMMRMGGCGMGHAMGHSHGKDGRSGQDGHDHSAHEHGGNAPMLESPESGTVIDPVSKQPVPANATVSCLYHGRAYYFESRKNRDVFESAPGRYLVAPPPADQHVAQSNSTPQHSHHRHGCC